MCMKTFFQQIFKDENGFYSSKRFAGILCVVTLNIVLLINVISKREFAPSENLVNAIETIALVSLGLTVLGNNIFGKKVEESSSSSITTTTKEEIIEEKTNE